MEAAILKENYRLKDILILLLTIILALISIIIAINGDITISIIISMLGFVIMVFGVFGCLKNYASLTMAFLAFMFLYTYAGVAAVVWGSGLHPIFNTIYQPEIFIVYSNIAYSVLYLGFLINYNTMQVKKITDYKSIKLNNNKKIVNRAILTSIIALLMEFINFIRVGGLSAVALGKAYYGSQMSELSFTLPSEMFLIVSGIYFSLYISNHIYKEFRPIKRKVILYIIPTSMLFLLYIILGMRGVLLSYSMILLAGYLYKKTINKISLKLIILILIVYFLFAIIYSARASIGFFLIENRDFQGFMDVVFRKERIVDALLPTEFTVAFGNFNQYITSTSNHILKLGSTYLVGLLIIIPGFLYPGTKPLQIVYEFRNAYFPSEAARGSIAGTGFSILLESYMNFGVFGIILTYFVIGLILAKLEKLRATNKNSILISAIYLSCFYFVAHFQRSSFADILSNIFMLLVVIVITGIGLIRIKIRK